LKLNEDEILMRIWIKLWKGSVKMRKCFTLVELLAVITVIGIVSSLILPSISDIRDKSLSASCKNKLRQIGIAHNIYTDNFNGLSMPADFGDTNNGNLKHWANYIINSGLSSDTITCPSLSKEENFDPAGHDPLTGNIYTEASYIMNIIPANGWNNTPYQIEGMGWCLDPETPININQVTKPFNTIYIVDVIAELSNSHLGVNSFSKSDWGELITPPTGNVRRVGIHHTNGFNSLFGDGSVKNLRQSAPEQWNTQQ
jgi:prepilin-type N-terminal cleavage/methylation domain-containing protein/prepilin-type processing-associated H-X9-DG protein